MSNRKKKGSRERARQRVTAREAILTSAFQELWLSTLLWLVQEGRVTCQSVAFRFTSHLFESCCLHQRPLTMWKPMKLAKQVGKHTSISLYKAVVTNNRKVHKPPNADKQSQNTVLFARKPLTCISETSPSGTAPKGISKQTYRKI
jgi:hypothetical protein